MKILWVLPFIPALVSANCGDMNKPACAMYKDINRVRKEAKLPPLKTSKKCVKAAQAHATDMLKKGYFSHNSPTQTFRERMQGHNIRGFYGENISMAPTQERALKGWLGSPGHKANILHSRYRYTGVGSAGKLWVQCFTSD